MKITNPTDDQLNAAFAEKVAGWTRHRTTGFVMDAWRDADDRFHMDAAPFTHSADAVLPWLEKAGRFNVFKNNEQYEIELEDKPMPSVGVYWGTGNSFPRAAVIALLRAHGVEVEFK